MLPIPRSVRRGFTLTEIMIVLVVLGLLMTVALPRVSQVLFTGKVSATRTSLGSISKACRNFNADTSCWPGNIGDLMQAPLAGAKGYHAKTLAGISYTDVHRRNWKGPYVDGTTAEVSVDAWGAKIAIGIVNGTTFTGFEIGNPTPVTADAGASDSWNELGRVPGLYLHSKGDDTATGDAALSKDDLYVFVSSATQ